MKHRTTLWRKPAKDARREAMEGEGPPPQSQLRAACPKPADLAEVGPAASIPLLCRPRILAPMLYPGMTKPSQHAEKGHVKSASFSVDVANTTVISKNVQANTNNKPAPKGPPKITEKRRVLGPCQEARGSMHLTSLTQPRKPAPCLPCGDPSIDMEITNPSSVFHHIHLLLSDPSVVECSYFTHSTGPPQNIHFVPRYLVDTRNCIRLDRTGLTFIKDGTEVEVATHREFVREMLLLSRLSRLPFFTRKYHRWRAFKAWRQLIRVGRLADAQARIGDLHIGLDPVIGGEVRRCYASARGIRDIRLFDWGDPNHTYDSSGFVAMQQRVRSFTLSRLSDLVEDLRNGLVEACSRSLRETTFDGLPLSAYLSAHRDAGHSPSSPTPVPKRLKPGKDSPGQEGVSFMGLGVLQKHRARHYKVARLADQFIFDALLDAAMANGRQLVQMLMHFEDDTLPCGECHLPRRLPPPSEGPWAPRLQLKLAVDEASGSIEIRPSLHGMLEILVTELRDIATAAATFSPLTRHEDMQECWTACMKQCADSSNLIQPSLDVEGAVWSLTEYKELPQQVTLLLQTSYVKAQAHRDNFVEYSRKYQKGLEFDVGVVTESAKAKTSSPQDYRSAIEELQEQEQLVMEIANHTVISIFRIDNSGLKSQFLPVIRRNLNLLIRALPVITQSRAADLLSTLEAHMSRLQKTPETADEAMAMVAFGGQVQESFANLRDNYTIVLDFSALTMELDKETAESVKIAVPSGLAMPAHPPYVEQLIAAWQQFVGVVDNLDTYRERNLQVLSGMLEVTLAELKEEVGKTFEDVTDCRLDDDQQDPEEMVALTSTCIQRLNDVADTLTKFNTFLRSVDRPAVVVPRIEEIKDIARAKHHLWKHLRALREKREEWDGMPINKLDCGAVGRDLQCLSEELEEINTKLGGSYICRELEQSIERYRVVLPLASALSTPSLRVVHLQQIDELLSTNLAKGGSVTLGAVVRGEMVRDIERVVSISFTAEMEAKVRGRYDSMTNTWQHAELELVAWKGGNETPYQVFGALPHVEARLDDAIIEIRGLLASPYIGSVSKMASALLDTLRQLRGMVQHLTTIQDMWMHLEPSYTSSEIQRVMPAEAKLFAELDRGYREVVKKTVQGGCNMQKVLHIPDLKNTLRRLISTGDGLMKKASATLDAKRAAFGRFYLLTDQQLMEVIANHSHTPSMPPILTMFGEMEHLEVDGTEGTTHVTSMVSSTGEILALEKPVRIRGSAEQWLGQVEMRMRGGVKDAIAEAYERFRYLKPVAFATAFPGQVALVVWLLHRTADFEAAVESGALHKLEVLRETLDKERDAFANALCSAEVTRKAVCTLQSLLTLVVHYQHLSLILLGRPQRELREPAAWLNEVKYWWDPGSSTASLCGPGEGSYPYGYEFLSTAPFAPVYPGTTTVFTALLQVACGNALQMPMRGLHVTGAAFQPELLKDMAICAGRQVYVLTCNALDSSPATFATITQRVLGAMITGWWLLLQNFDTIPAIQAARCAEIWTVLAEMNKDPSKVLSRLALLHQPSTTSPFTSLGPPTGMVLVSSTGYSPSPGAFHSFFHRTVSLLSPTRGDLRVIAEVYVAACGEPRSITAKLVYAVDHCCAIWGDRGPSAEAILRQSYELWRTLNAKLGRAISLMAVFAMLAGKVDGSLEANTTEVVRKVSHTVLATAPPHEWKAQPPPEFAVIVNDCSLLLSRNVTLCLVGECGTGKSPVIRFLAQQLHSKIRLLVPAAIPASTMWGQCEGSALRTIANLIRGEGPSFLVFDGNPDPGWTDPLLSAIGTATPKLCSARGGVLSWLPSKLSVIFECRSLAHATPHFCGKVALVPFAEVQIKPRDAVLWQVHKYSQATGRSLTKTCDKHLVSAVERICGLADEVATEVAQQGYLALPVPPRSLLESAGCLIAAFLFHYPEQEDWSTHMKRSYVEKVVLFSVLWGICSSIPEQARLKVHERFAGFAHTMPPGDIFSWCLNPNGTFLSWLDSQHMVNTPHGPDDSFVYTSDNTRCLVLMRLFSLVGRPAILVGKPLSGKTAMLEHAITGLPHKTSWIVFSWSPLAFDVDTMAHRIHGKANAVYSNTQRSVEQQLLVVVEDLSLAHDHPSPAEVLREVVVLRNARSSCGLVTDLPTERGARPYLFATTDLMQAPTNKVGMGSVSVPLLAHSGVILNGEGEALCAEIVQHQAVQLFSKRASEKRSDLARALTAVIRDFMGVFAVAEAEKDPPPDMVRLNMMSVIRVIDGVTRMNRASMQLTLSPNYVANLLLHEVAREAVDAFAVAYPSVSTRRVESQVVDLVANRFEGVSLCESPKTLCFAEWLDPGGCNALEQTEPNDMLSAFYNYQTTAGYSKVNQLWSVCDLPPTPECLCDLSRLVRVMKLSGGGAVLHATVDSPSTALARLAAH
eukprot:Sspe_Gene.72808::Locus_43621_Transcript_1_1_Confidence_1.000_Length_7296::g.72808::m.72808/K10408/DNAH; dynein heavy chain, axonemal